MVFDRLGVAHLPASVAALSESWPHARAGLNEYSQKHVVYGRQGLMTAFSDCFPSGAVLHGTGANSFGGGIQVINTALATCMSRALGHRGNLKAAWPRSLTSGYSH